MIRKWLSLIRKNDERRLALFPAETIVRDPHHRESPTRFEQDLNLRSGFVEWGCLVVWCITQFGTIRTI